MLLQKKKIDLVEGPSNRILSCNLMPGIVQRYKQNIWIVDVQYELYEPTLKWCNICSGPSESRISTIIYDQWHLNLTNYGKSQMTLQIIWLINGLEITYFIVKCIYHNHYIDLVSVYALSLSLSDEQMNKKHFVLAMIELGLQPHEYCASHFHRHGKAKMFH